MISRFLPPDFSPGRPIAVIAGRGRYPILTVERIRAHGLEAKLIAFEGETEDSLLDSFDPADRAVIKVGQLGHMLKALKRNGSAYVVMAGQITPRKLFKGLHPDLKAITILASLKERNAETIFGAIAREIADIGVHQLDARVFLDDQLADTGCMTGGTFKVETDVLEHGIHIAREVARLGIGQGVVVNRGTVLAVEAFEGTDPMLRRAGTFTAPSPLFVKTIKPGQDFRFDVPVFGTRTLDVMDEANIRSAAVEAHNTLILDKPLVLEYARKLKIQLYGFSPGQNSV